jgi:DNA (cytosine-5)-methyltransferase 1
MKFLSVCSGIEAASCAWDWEAVAFSEIEKFPSQVLSYHYPETPNWGDMTKFKEWPDANVDVLVGGTPCQSFSVAGLRKGLDDPRGNLMLTYLAIAAKYRPKWVVWENVPGVLSSNGGLDFASFLRGLGECGYGFAYRVLDAQYFGVPQRRRRVFVVGCFGDWRSAAAVLFERHSLSGNPAPSREKRQSIAASTGTGAANSNWPAEISSTLDTTFGTKQGLENQHINAGCPMFVPAQPIALAENTIGRQPQNGGNGDGFTDGGPMYTLNATGVHGVAQQIVFSGQMSNPQTDVDMTQTLQAKNPMAVCLGGQHPNAGIGIDQSPTLTNAMGAGGGHIPITNAMQVRRLTPVECERLQGFPDGYTDIKLKGKPTPDGLRYKALGNSMAVPVMRWIGQRIEAVDRIK